MQTPPDAFGKKYTHDHGWSFPITGLIFQVRKVTGGGGGGGWVACRIIVSVPFLWFLDLELGFGTGLVLDKNGQHSRAITLRVIMKVCFYLTYGQGCFLCEIKRS